MRLCVFSERLALPGDEGIRNYVVNLIRALTRRHEVLALTTFGADVPEWGVRNVAGNQLLLTVDLARRVCAFRQLRHPLVLLEHECLGPMGGALPWLLSRFRCDITVRWPAPLCPLFAPT
jgi:hypothetical protein